MKSDRTCPTDSKRRARTTKPQNSRFMVEVLQKKVMKRVQRQRTMQTRPMVFTCNRRGSLFSLNACRGCPADPGRRHGIFPYFYRPILTGGRDVAAIRAEGDAVDPTGVAAQGDAGRAHPLQPAGL